MQSISLNIRQAVEASGLSRSALYVALKDGRLTARKAGRRTVILTDDLAAFVRGLPKMEAGNG